MKEESDCFAGLATASTTPRLAVSDSEQDHSNLSQRYQRHLPQELIDCIIDELHDDRISLALCALVSRSWVNESRHHLFMTVNLQAYDSLESPLPSFSELLLNNLNLQQFVRTLMINNKKAFIHPVKGKVELSLLGSILGRLPNLRTLSLHWVQIAVASDLRSSLLSMEDALDLPEVVLWGVDFQVQSHNEDSFDPFLRLFTHIGFFDLDWCRVIDTHGEKADVIRENLISRLRVHRLQVMACARPIEQALYLSIVPSRIRFAAVGFLWFHGKGVLSSFLCNPEVKLTALELNWNYVNPLHLSTDALQSWSSLTLRCCRWLSLIIIRLSIYEGRPSQNVFVWSSVVALLATLPITFTGRLELYVTLLHQGDYVGLSTSIHELDWDAFTIAVRGKAQAMKCYLLHHPAISRESFIQFKNIITDRLCGHGERAPVVCIEQKAIDDWRLMAGV